MAKKTSTDAFRAPALKYQGKMQILGGPIPIGEMHRPYVRKERDRPLGAEGKDLRPERPEIQKAPPASVARAPKHTGKGGS
jgi:hypothetical protein